MESFRVGSFIAQLRKEKNLTQQVLANQLGVTNKAVSKWETGEGYPEITMLPTLADALDVTADELLRGERQPDSHAETAANGLALKFRKAVFRSVVTALAGLVALYAVTAVTSSDAAGFAAFMLFLAGSIVLFSVAYYDTKPAVKSHTGLNASLKKHAELSAQSDRTLFIMIHVWVACLMAALPFVLFYEGFSWNNTIYFSVYMPYVPIFLMIGGTVTFFICKWIWARLKLGGVDFNLSFETKELKKSKARLNIMSALYIVVLSTALFLVQASINEMDNFFSSGIPVIWLVGILCFIVFVVLFIFKYRTNGYNSIKIWCGIRNLLCLLIISNGAISSVCYESIIDPAWKVQTRIAPWIAINSIALAVTLFAVTTFALWFFEYIQFKPGTRPYQDQKLANN